MPQYFTSNPYTAYNKQAALSDLEVRCEKCVTAEAISGFQSKIQLQTNYDILVLLSHWKSVTDIGSSAGHSSNQGSSSSFQTACRTDTSLINNK
jgi:hypothetical protein